MKLQTKTLLVISALLGIAAVILIVISMIGQFETNWVLAAGLGCVALGSLINFISIFKNRK